MQPVRRQTFGDGMRAIEYEHFEVMARAVARVEARAFRNCHDPPVHNGQAWPEALFAPAEADHFVVLGPFGKRVVRGVEHDKAAAVADVLLQRDFGFARPSRAVFQVAAIEVVHDHVVAGEIGRLGGPGCDVDFEPATAFENGADRARARFPVVIVHAVDNQRGELAIGAVCGQRGEQSDGDEPIFQHDTKQSIQSECRPGRRMALPAGIGAERSAAPGN
jgi:hypothetical protein